VRLVGPDVASRWDGRGHFFAAAADAMRRILIEDARRTGRLRHGGGRRRVELDEALLSVESSAFDAIALDEALDGLAVVDRQAAEFVKLRDFAELTVSKRMNSLGSPSVRPTAPGRSRGPGSSAASGRPRETH
jgi:hypothetical protein